MAREHNSLTDRLSRDNCTCLKGIFAIFVLVHHLYQRSGLLHGTLLGGILQAMGYLSVAMFFFLSGYGLMTSINRKGIAYVNELPRRKILPFYCIVILLTLLYLVFFLCMGNAVSFNSIVRSVTFGGTIVGNGWYLQMQFVLYIIVFLVFRQCGGTKRAKILIVAALVSLMSTVLHVLDFSTTWYESVGAFVVGMAWSSEKNKIDKFLLERRNWWMACGVTFGLFCAFFLGAHLFSTEILKLLCKIISALVFVTFVTSVIYVVSVSCAVTRFVGKISLGIYASQGLFLLLFHSSLINIDDPYIYIAVTTACTFVAAYALCPTFEYIYSKFRRLSKMEFISMDERKAPNKPDTFFEKVEE